MKTQVIEKVEIVEDENTVRELKAQIIQMKEATKFLTKKLDEEMTKAPKVEKVVETAIEYKVPEDIHEKMLKKEKDYNALLEQVKSETDKREDLIEKYDDLSEKYSELAEKYSDLTNSITEKEEEDKSLFREILEDKQKEFDDLTEQLENVESMYQSVSKGKEESDRKIVQLAEDLKDTKARYYSTMYKVELRDVKKLMETISNEKDLEKALVNNEKLNKRLSPQIIEVPEYKPNKRSTEKSAFLEKLTR